MTDLAEVRRDLLDEQAALDVIVARLSDDQWLLPTPSPGWNVTDQVGHLTYFDGAAAQAVTDPPAFRAGVEALFASAAGASDGGDDFTLASFRSLNTDERLSAWRTNRQLLADAAATLTESTRVAWYGPSMGAKSFLTARLMEVWAHGTDIADALGITREPTDRLRHIAQLGFITRGWSYTVRGQTAPEGDVRLVLTGPSGNVFAWGPDSAADTVSGSIEDFCLVVTQRRHVDDTALQAGELGRHWLLRAQAFAGGPTDVPAPRGA
jgi:uncharacterized protein (TIGR03084 family)